MSEVALQRFSCDGCGKSYPWKPELSNKKAKCKCGQTIIVPDLSVPDDEPPALPDDGILDFIENAPEVASSRAEAFRAAAAIPVAVAAPAKTRAAPVLGYRQGPTARDRKRANEAFGTMHDMKRDVYVPTGLLVGSFLAYFAWLFIHGAATSGESLGLYAAVMIALFAVKTVCMIGGAFIVASLASVSFGPFWTAILKLAAVAVAPDILATVVEEAIGSPGAWIVANAVALGFYWFLISWLFSMDANEAWIVVVLFGFLRYILGFVVGMIILSLVMSGSSAASITGASAITGSTKSATAEAIALSESVDNWKENDLVVEGLEYIDTSGRQSAMQDTIKALYAAGAKNVWFHVARDINGKKEPMSLIAEWPRDAKKRVAMEAAIKDRQAVKAKNWLASHPNFPLTEPPITDEGGKYVEIPLGG